MKCFMKNSSKLAPIVIACFLMFFGVDSNCQGLKSLRKAKDALKGILLEEEVKEGNSSDSNAEDRSSKSSSEKTLNTRMTSQELIAVLDNAQTEFDNQKYSSARYSIQQALVEIELQMGELVLAAMPRSVRGQDYDPDADEVISTGVGFIGLDISREYPSDEGMISAQIANNAAMMTPYTMALSSPTMISQNEDMKSVTVNGKRGILELDAYNDRFKLILPFGQSSALLLECETCQNESEVLDAASQFDLDGYLEIMGETPITTE